MQITRIKVTAPVSDENVQIAPPDGHITHPDITHTRIENLSTEATVEIVDGIDKELGEGFPLPPGGVIEYASGQEELYALVASGEPELLVTTGKGPFAPKAGPKGDPGAAGSAVSAVTTDVQAGTAYTLALADAGKVVEFTSAEPVVLTVPTNAEAAIPVGSIIELYRAGAGTVTVTPAGGVTVHSDGAKTHIAGQFGTARLRKRAANEWVLSGDLS